MAGARLISSARMMLLKDRSLSHLKGICVGAIDLRAEDVCGQEVGRELDPLKRGLDGGGERLDGRGLCEPRQTFEQEVTVAKETDEHPLHKLALPDHRLFHLRRDLPENDALLLDSPGDLLNIHELIHLLSVRDLWCGSRFFSSKNTP